MAQMEWQEAYSVGNPVLDSQHKELIALVNKVGGDVDLGEVLAGLRRYGETHFETEESLLEAAGYPDLEEHKKFHDAFRNWLGGVMAAYRAGEDDAAVRRDIHHYLCVWLANHLLVHDKAFASWLAKTPELTLDQ